MVWFQILTPCIIIFMMICFNLDKFTKVAAFFCKYQMKASRKVAAPIFYGDKNNIDATPLDTIKEQFDSLLYKNKILTDNHRLTFKLNDDLNLFEKGKIITVYNYLEFLKNKGKIYSRYETKEYYAANFHFDFVYSGMMDIKNPCIETKYCNVFRNLYIYVENIFVVLGANAFEYTVHHCDISKKHFKF